MVIIHYCYIVAVSKSSLPFITQGLISTEEKFLTLSDMFVQPVARDKINEGRNQ
jgi:hypothetical protein